jgi:uncharacterized protein YyaL (SSP411 family)
MKKIITIIFFSLIFVAFSVAQNTSTKTKTTTTKTTSKTPSTTTKTSTNKQLRLISQQQTSSTTTTKAIYTPLKEDGTLKWLTFEEAIKLNETKPAQFFIDFYTSWCGWCKVLDTKTFQDPFVAKFMGEHFYCVKFDAEQKPDINFQNKTWKWVAGGRNGYHELAAFFMQGQMSYPTCTVLTSKFELVYPLKGYVKVEEFEPLITFLGKELYKTPNNNYEEYKSKYKR